MKPEIVKSLYDKFLQQQQQPTYYDAVDGVYYTERIRHAHAQSSESGEAGFSIEDRLSELQFIHPEASLPHQPYHAALNHAERELVERFGRQLSDIANEYETEVIGGRSVSLVDGFQFTKQCLFIAPTAMKVTLTVVRSGNSDSVSTLTWKTKDDTAKAGIHYVNSSGNIHFGKGETQKDIEIQLLSDHKDNLITFIVELDSELEEDESRNAVSVNITNCENFPSEEQSIMRRIIGSQCPTFIEVTTYLSEKVTTNTLKTAMLYLCGNATDLEHKFYFAFSLVKFAQEHYISRDHAMNILCNFFQRSPEIENIVTQKSHDEDSENENSEDEDSENEDLD